MAALRVAESAPRTGRPFLCHPTKLNTRYIPDGFCWDIDDDKSSNYNNSGPDPGGWVPQGLTASHDGDNQDGKVAGSHVYAASWYRGKDGSKDEFVRVSFVKNTGTQTTYGHVLLVEPAGTTFKAVTNTHADGLTWYGNKLFVANGAELQVYDLTHIWKMTGPPTEFVGVRDGASSARWHIWAMPMIAKYRTYDYTNPRQCEPGVGNLCLSSLSLDRTGADSLVSGEYRTNAGGGRIVHWPLDPSTALPRVDATEQSGKIQVTRALLAFSTPVWAVQGVASDGTYLYMAGQCPPGWNGDISPDAKEAYSCIHRAKVGEAPHVFTMAPRMTQNLSYSRFSGRLWGLNENIDTTVGDRVVFSIDVDP